MGHDSERAAMIYQHEEQGADNAITAAIDSHVRGERGQDHDGRPVSWHPSANGPEAANDLT